MRQEVHLNRDNDIKLGMVLNTVPQDVRTMTRCVLQFEPKGGGALITIDSNTVPAEFDLTQTFTYGGVTTGILILILGADAALLEAKYTCTVILYDVANPGGAVWGKMDVDVLDDAT